MVNHKIGIEHIEAVPENHVRASIFRKKGVGPQVHLLQKHRPGESRRSNDAILSEIIQDRAGAPWVGNEVEVEWAEVMLHCIKGKEKYSTSQASVNSKRIGYSSTTIGHFQLFIMKRQVFFSKSLV
jgi:hypothetical protein